MSNNRKDEVAIRNLIESWASAVRRRDLDGVLRDHSADIVMFDLPLPLQVKGIEAYKETWDLFFSWARDPVIFDIKEMGINADQNVGFVSAIMRCAGTETNGENVEFDFRLTVGLRKIDDQWIVVHEHHSIPAEY